jgi:hypothetical protein
MTFGQTGTLGSAAQAYGVAWSDVQAVISAEAQDFIQASTPLHAGPLSL